MMEGEGKEKERKREVQIKCVMHVDFDTLE